MLRQKNEWRDSKGRAIFGSGAVWFPQALTLALALLCVIVVGLWPSRKPFLIGPADRIFHCSQFVAESSNPFSLIAESVAIPNVSVITRQLCSVEARNICDLPFLLRSQEFRTRENTGFIGWWFAEFESIRQIAEGQSYPRWSAPAVLDAECPIISRMWPFRMVQSDQNPSPFRTSQAIYGVLRRSGLEPNKPDSNQRDNYAANRCLKIEAIKAICAGIIGITLLIGCAYFFYYDPFIRDKPLEYSFIPAILCFFVSLYCFGFVDRFWSGLACKGQQDKEQDTHGSRIITPTSRQYEERKESIKRQYLA